MEKLRGIAVHAGVQTSWFGGLFFVAMSVTAYSDGSGLAATISALIATFILVRAARIAAAMLELDREGGQEESTPATTVPPTGQHDT